MIKHFAGIYVQINRGCCYYIIDEDKEHVTSGWEKENIPQSLKNLFLNLTNNQLHRIAVYIDAPRMPIKRLRTRYYDKKKIEWIDKSKKSSGRRYEVIVESNNLANPQWAKTYSKSPDWMRHGFRIFAELKIC